MLPDLSGLRLVGPAPRQCVPVGQTFPVYKKALKRIRRVAARKPNAYNVPPLDVNGMCAICYERLDRESMADVSRYEDLANSTEVEALFENTGCGHCFHRTCLEIHMRSGEAYSRRCPLCRKPIDQAVLDTVFQPPPPLPPPPPPSSMQFGDYNQSNMLRQPGEAWEGFTRRQNIGTLLSKIYIHVDPRRSATLAPVLSEASFAIDQLAEVLSPTPEEAEWRISGFIFVTTSNWLLALLNNFVEAEFGVVQFQILDHLLNTFPSIRLPMFLEGSDAQRDFERFLEDQRVAMVTPNAGQAWVNRLRQLEFDNGVTPADGFNMRCFFEYYDPPSSRASTPPHYDGYGMGNSGF